MRFLSIVKSAENQGPAPQALQDAMARLTRDSLKDGSLVQSGGLGGYAVLEFESREEAIEAAVAFMRLHNERSEEHTSELQSRLHLVCRLLLEKKKNKHQCSTVRSRPCKTNGNP